MNAEGEFFSDEAAILRELTNSKVNHNAVGIACEKLGRGMFITVVEDIIKTDFVTIIILRPYDASGYFLPINKIMLDEIISLYPFRSQFANPFLEQAKRDEGIEKLKNLIR